MSDQTMILPKETAQALVDLTGEVRLDAALTLVMRDNAFFVSTLDALRTTE